MNINEHAALTFVPARAHAATCAHACMGAHAPIHAHAHAHADVHTVLQTHTHALVPADACAYET